MLSLMCARHSWPASVINARGKDEGIKSTEGPYNERLRALNNYNAQIKQSYYYYNSFKSCCVFLRVLFFALFNQIVQVLVT